MTLSRIQEALLGRAEQDGQLLDPFAFDDAAILLRAERLVLSGSSGSHALTQAREELSASRWPLRDSGEPLSASERLALPQPTLEQALLDPALYAEFIAPFASEVIEANDPDEELPPPPPDSRQHPLPQTDIPDGKET